MRKLSTLITVMLSGVVLVSSLSMASDHGEALKLRQSGEILPLTEILDKAKAAQPGELLEAELEAEDGQLVYEIEIYGDDGRYHELYLDARTGELLKREQE